jgi:hypothetical protein
MLAADSSILWSRAEELPGPEQIDAWLQKRVPGGRVYPRTGLGAAYCLWGRVYGVRPEVLVAQGAQECYFYREYENTHWIQWNNPAGMVYYAGRFEESDAPAGINREGHFARFATKRHGIKVHCRLARDYAARGYGTTGQFLNAWGTGQTAKVVAWANEIRAQPRLKPPGIRDEYTQYALVNLMGLGIMQGYPDGYLRSEWPLTRAEMAALLIRAFASRWRKEREVTTPPDVRGHWAEEEIRRVMQAGWMEGFPDGKFRPDDYLTRAQTCVMLARIGAPRFVYRRPAQLSDVRPENWYYDQVMWAYQNGWLGEFIEKDIYGGRRFLPDFPISRGEMGHLVWQLARLQPVSVRAAVGQTVGQAPRRESLVPAVWLGTEKRWVPAWAVPVFVSEREAWEQPVTMVPAEVVEPWPRTVLRNPAVLAVGAAAGITAGAGIYFLLKE